MAYQNNYVVVIPSRSPENLTACLTAIEDNQPDADVIVVDNSRDSSLNQFFPKSIGLYFGVDYIPYRDLRGGSKDWTKGFVFADAVNMGIGRAGRTKDVIVMNDDALLETPEGFDQLKAAEEDHDGLISATVRGVVGNPDQSNKGADYLSWTDRHLAFICVYISQSLIRRVGLLDTRFTGYGWEDTDYCERVKRAGGGWFVEGKCVVEHGLTLKSTYRDNGTPPDFEEGKRKFLEKWPDVVLP